MNEHMNLIHFFKFSENKALKLFKLTHKNFSKSVGPSRITFRISLTLVSVFI